MTPISTGFGSLWISPAHVVLFVGAVQPGQAVPVARPSIAFPGEISLTLQAAQLDNAGQVMLSNPATVLLY